MHRPKITAVGLVNLHAYARPNVNYEVSAQMGQFYVAVYSMDAATIAAHDAPNSEGHTPRTAAVGAGRREALIAVSETGASDDTTGNDTAPIPI